MEQDKGSDAARMGVGGHPFRAVTLEADVRRCAVGEWEEMPVLEG